MGKEVVVIGQVSRIFPDKGYGFITTEESEQFFFHMSALKGIEWKTLIALCSPEGTLGPHVYFKEQKHQRGPRAINVELIPND